VVKLSLRWVPRLNLGRHVWYQGQKWVLVQGVCAPRWDLALGDIRKDFVCESEFHAVQNPIEWWNAFCSGYRFYMLCWYDVWVNEGIQSWMLNCNIWAKDKR
jgi:hypothetical protein